MLEINRRIGSGWKAFNRFHEFLTSKSVAMGLKARVYKICIEPALLYGCEIWNSTKKLRTRLITAQRSIMRKMAGVTRLHRVCNEWLENRVPIQDIRIRAMQKKWEWAKRIASLNDDRWTERITNWTPLNKKRSIGRPKTRWRDEITLRLGPNWQSVCRRYPDVWKTAIIQQAQTLKLE